MVQPNDSTSPPLDSTTQHAYASLFADAVRVLTAAARLSWPAPEGAGEGRGEPVDWAEFVTLALAGAAANIGHVEAVLAGRAGSWEAEGVRQLLWSTVGDDDQEPMSNREALRCLKCRFARIVYSHLHTDQDAAKQRLLAAA